MTEENDIYDENGYPKYLRVRPETEDLKRAWLMVKVADSNIAADLPLLAAKIINAVNSNTDGEYPNFDFVSIDKAFAIRADITWDPNSNDNIYHLVVPVNAANTEQIGEMARLIEIEAGEGSEVDKVIVLKHVPENPYHANGFVAYGEENKEQGLVHPEGHNPWG